jgi:sec-independent protein translocase protein TatA
MNEWVIVAIVAVVVIFGATKLPEIARNFGKAQGEFKKGLKEGAVSDETGETKPAEPRSDA